MKLTFACRCERQRDGTQVIRCRDLPELLSGPAEVESFETWARYAVLDCIGFRRKHGEAIPMPSEPLPGEFVVGFTSDEVAGEFVNQSAV